jgi:hypothetical protein
VLRGHFRVFVITEEHAQHIGNDSDGIGLAGIPGLSR